MEMESELYDAGYSVGRTDLGLAKQLIDTEPAWIDGYSQLPLPQGQGLGTN